MRILPSSFRFSLKVTLTCLTLATIMIICAFWQWSRYEYKTALLSTYEHHNDSIPKDFPLPTSEKKVDYTPLLHHKVALRGTYDFAHQLIIKNRKHSSGPGFWLVTPFHPDGSPAAVLVSRGFIPFPDRTQESWKKYDFQEDEILLGVVQESSTAGGFLAPKNPKASTGSPWITEWLTPELENMAAQFPYPVITDVYLQRLGTPPQGEFPAESVRLRVPPGTHFGYTIEWSLMALATLLVGFFIQAFPRKKIQVMRGKSQSSSLLSAFCVLFAAHCLQLSAEAQSYDLDSPITEDITIIERLGEFVPLGTEFQNSAGETKPLSDFILPGRPVIITPVYFRCPQLCNLTLNGTLKVIKELELSLGSDYTVISASFSPKETSPLALKKSKNYFKQLPNPNAGERGWYFLVGKQNSINELMESLGFQYKPEADEFLHAAAIMVLTPQGKISRYFYGVEYKATDLKLALVEASEGRVGTTFDRVLLFCFRFDPLLGKYSLQIMNLTKIICVIAVAILFSGLVYMKLTESKLKGPADV